MPVTRAFRAIASVVLIMMSLALVGKIAWSAYGPQPSARQLTEQVRFLETSVADGSADEMQQLFPEGFFFQHALTGIAAARTVDADPATVRAHLIALDSPKSTAVFGDQMTPEHGIFQAGWTLSLAVDLYVLDRSEANTKALTQRAQVVEQALAGSRTGFLEGYPGQYWPCDTVVAASALSRAAEELDRPEWIDTVGTWRDRTEGHLDPETGLLPHRVNVTGKVIEGARGSSQAIIQAFRPDIDEAVDGTPDLARWRHFTDTFVTRELGLIGVRQFPRGLSGTGDVDSGPLVAGVSVSASAVTLMAARRVGDVDLAGALNREAELLGLPIAFGGNRSYALGQLPIGDAFLAFARSLPLTAAPAAMTNPAHPVRPLWELFLILALIPGVIGILLGRRILRPKNPARD